MKKTHLLLLTLFAAVACFPDDRDHGMVPDSFGLTGISPLTETSVHTGSYTLGVVKNGKGLTAASVRLGVGAEACAARLEAYNQANGTHFQAVPLTYLEWTASDLSFTAEEVVKPVTLSWEPAHLARLLGSGTDYVIPVLLSSDDLTVSPGHDFVLIRLNRSEAYVKQTQLSRVVEAKDVETGKNGVQPELLETITLDLMLDPAIKGMGMTLPITIGDTQAPEGLVTLLDPSVTLAEGSLGGSFRIQLDKGKLLKDGKLEPFPDYVIPIRVQEEKLQASLNGEAFDLQGLAWGNLCTYLTVSFYQAPEGLSVIRLWGLYSDKNSAWSDYLPGFTAGADRNVTLDDENLYIAETNGSKHLWAISLQAPDKYSLLPVGTVIDNGTFHLSCPRVIPNTDAAINGGKPVLAVSSMHTGGDPVLYIYDKGITADPSLISLTTWASRRLGDTFSWWGSLQDGVLLFKDFNSEQGTVTFWMRGKLSPQFYLVGRVQAPPVTGAGAYFPFPESSTSGIASTRGGQMSWLVNTKDLNKLEGADNAPTLTELDPVWADCSFRFFSFDGKRYIAVAKQDSAAAGRLIILEGPAGMPWEIILTEGEMVYTAAIQNETEQEALSEEPSPMASGNSGMDLDVSIVENQVFIAVLKQNVGLSVFRMSVN